MPNREGGFEALRLGFRHAGRALGVTHPGSEVDWMDAAHTRVQYHGSWD
jgi:hypothetical protein